jgi:hypothetical protein
MSETGPMSWRGHLHGRRWYNPMDGVGRLCREHIVETTPGACCRVIRQSHLAKRWHHRKIAAVALLDNMLHALSTTYFDPHGCGKCRRIVWNNPCHVGVPRNDIDIPVILENAGVLATLTRPNHLVYLSSWGFTRLPPPCISNDFRYRFMYRAREYG